jgi:hypothetical protein
VLLPVFQGLRMRSTPLLEILKDGDEGRYPFSKMMFVGLSEMENPDLQERRSLRPHFRRFENRAVQDPHHFLPEFWF